MSIFEACILIACVISYFWQMDFEILHTERLLLRKASVEEFHYIFKHYNDEELKAFFGLTTDEELQKEKDKYNNGYTSYNRSFLLFHLIDKATQQNIGACGFHNWFAMHSRSEIGYHLRDESNKRKGFMKEALQAIIAYGFNNMNLNRIEAVISPKNEPSLKLAKHYNFKQEGYLKEHYCLDGVLEDSVIFGLLKKEYEAQ